MWKNDDGIAANDDDSGKLQCLMDWKCLCEAQQVKVQLLAKIARKLITNKKWCVSRTPIGGGGVGVYIVMVGIYAIEIASDAILIAPGQSTDHILAGQTAT